MKLAKIHMNTHSNDILFHCTGMDEAAPAPTHSPSNSQGQKDARKRMEKLNDWSLEPCIDLTESIVSKRGDWQNVSDKERQVKSPSRLLFSDRGMFCGEMFVCTALLIWLPQHVPLR